MKSRKVNLILFGVLALLAGIYFFTAFRKGGASVDKDEIAFAIRDTAGLEGIRLRLYLNGAAKEEVNLTKANGLWVLDGKAPVNPYQIQTFLGLASRIEMRDKLNDQGRANVLKQLKDRHVLVTYTYADGSEQNVLVGSAAVNYVGTYMMVEGFDSPYIVEVPGHDGYITPIFSTNQADWRETVLFSHIAANIRGVALQFEGADSSYVLIKDAAGWRVEGAPQADTFNIQKYVGQFKGKVYALATAEDKFPGIYDSLKTAKPYAVLQIDDTKTGKAAYVFHKLKDYNDVYVAWNAAKPEPLLVQAFGVARYLIPRRIFTGNVK